MGANAVIKCCCRCAGPSCTYCTDLGDYTPTGYVAQVYFVEPVCCVVDGLTANCSSGGSFPPFVPSGTRGAVKASSPNDTFLLAQFGNDDDGCPGGLGEVGPPWDGLVGTSNVCAWEYREGVHGLHREMRLYGTSAPEHGDPDPDCSGTPVAIWDEVVNPGPPISTSPGTQTQAFVVALYRVDSEHFDLFIWQMVTAISVDDPCGAGPVLDAVYYPALVFAGRSPGSTVCNEPFRVNNGSHPDCQPCAGHGGYAIVTPCLPPPVPSNCIEGDCVGLDCCENPDDDVTPNVVDLYFDNILGNPKCLRAGDDSYRVKCLLSGLTLVFTQDPDRPCIFIRDVSTWVQIWKCTAPPGTSPDALNCNCDPYMGTNITTSAVMEYEINAMTARVVMTTSDDGVGALNVGISLEFFDDEDYSRPCCVSITLKVPPAVPDGGGGITSPDWNSIVGSDPFGGSVTKVNCTLL